jgi:hypothetical protein
VALSCGTLTGASNRTLVAHDFETSADGWLVSGDTGMAEPAFHAEGGNPGGYISAEDEAMGETWYFRAPAAVLVQLPAAEGGTLSYSLKQSSPGGSFLDDDVVIAGPAGRLSYRFKSAPGSGWTDFSVRLSATVDWRWNWNARATQDQIRAVLQNPSLLEIRGEFQTGPDTAGFDNVVVSAAE